MEKGFWFLWIHCFLRPYDSYNYHPNNVKINVRNCPFVQEEKEVRRSLPFVSFTVNRQDLTNIFFLFDVVFSYSLLSKKRNQASGTRLSHDNDITLIIEQTFANINNEV